MKTPAFVLFVVLLTFFNCKQSENQNIDANLIIDKAIEVSGGEQFKTSAIHFTFRDKQYKAMRNAGQFQLERHFKDSINTIKDVLMNDGFTRFINEERQVIADSIANNYSNSVNSVHYFSVLPFGLNTKAVQKEYLKEETIKGKNYHKIKVFFNENGGGEDFEDIFVYWVNTETFKVDYLAYEYATDGGGKRFREAYNERFVNGLRFVDYNNYKSEDKTESLYDLGKLFENESLKLLSKIELEAVEVE